LVGAGFGLALGAIYLIGGLDRAVADHAQAVRIARQAGGALSETMLQREMDRLDPAALTLARAHDALAAADAVTGPLIAWPGRFGARFPVGRHASALDSARDLTCLTEAVYFEARGETPRGQAAVAQVVLNRVASPNFPKSVCGVVFQGAAHAGCQFSFACDGSMRRGLETAAWDRARHIAERALAGVAGGGIGSATHFHTVDVQPDWGPQMIRVAQVGLHIFYRPNPHAAALAQQALQQAAQLRPAAMERAVLTSQPYAPAAPLHVSPALVETASDVAATHSAPEAKSAESVGVPAAADAAAP
jgi:spore germination cell wall hydrolase CwlJ-like protein